MVPKVLQGTNKQVEALTDSVDSISRLYGRISRAASPMRVCFNMQPDHSCESGAIIEGLEAIRPDIQTGTFRFEPGAGRRPYEYRDRAHQKDRGGGQEAPHRAQQE